MARAGRQPETPPPAQPGTEQFIEIHKAWIAAATGTRTRRSRLPLTAALTTAVVAGVLALAALGPVGRSPSAPADLASELIPASGGSKAAGSGGTDPVARSFRKVDEAAARPQRARAGERDGGAGAGTVPADGAEAALREKRVPSASVVLTSPPDAQPQVTDGREGAGSDSARPR